MIDVLAFGAHPDDIELGAGGTLVKQVRNGSKVGMVDLTEGEMGTRGSVSVRREEAKKAADIIGAEFRINLKMDDAFISMDKKSILSIVRVIRKYKPKIVLCNAIKDRHPDHAIAAKLVSKACFTSGLAKVETVDNSVKQLPFRPLAVYHYIQDKWIDPDFVMDISPEYTDKIKAVKAFKSQFYNPSNKEPQTPISSKEFLDSLTAKAVLFGRSINTHYGEGFTVERPIGVNNLFNIT